ncbi:putative phospholipid-transporting ATPase 11, partial [Taenia solium]
MLLLASSNCNGKVYITTDNLDGESSVKTTNTLSFTQSALASAVQHIQQKQYDDVTIHLPRSTIVCQQPNEDLRSFEGSLNYDEESTPLSLNNLVLRGANLRHTAFVLGVAVYTGADTKLSLNGKPGFRKFSSSSQAIQRNPTGLHGGHVPGNPAGNCFALCLATLAPWLGLVHSQSTYNSVEEGGAVPHLIVHHKLPHTHFDH